MQLNQPAPEFLLPDLQGTPCRLSDYRGRIVILNFWSAECPHSERADRSTMACLVQWGEDVEMLSIAANRNPKVRAALAHDVTSARLSREHNDANVVAFGQRLIGVETAREALKVFLATPFVAGRHASRVPKLSKGSCT